MKTQPKMIPTVNLRDHSDDIIYHIMMLIHEDGYTLRNLAETCTRFYYLFHNLRFGGLYALPIRLPTPAKEPRGLHLTQYPMRRVAQYDPLGKLGHESNRKETAIMKIRKNADPGTAHIAFTHDVSQTSSAWRVQLDEFRTTRIEMGVATCEAFRFDTVERASSWSFDNFGRASSAGHRTTYGRVMRTGDTVTVVYDASRRLLSFLDGNRSMGALRVNVAKTQALFPFIYFSSVPNEAVTILQPPRTLINLAQVHASAHEYLSPMGGTVSHATGRLIVLTVDDQVWYAINVDGQTTTLAQLWKEIERKHNLSMHLFELIFKGRRLPYSSRLKLGDVGIHIDKRSGSCSSDILLSVPHLAS